MRVSRFGTGALAALALACASPLQAAVWSSTNLWLLNGKSFELGTSDRTILRLEHASGFEYGDVYFFVDSTEPSERGTALYEEFTTRVSLSRLSGRDRSAGLFQDALLAVQINNGADFRAYLYGPSVDLKLPGFSYAQLNLYARDDDAQAGRTWQFTPVWRYPFKLAGQSLAFQGFVDWIGNEGRGAFRSHTNLVAAPRLFWDVGALWNAAGRIEIGAEYFYWRNKFGVAGVTEKVFQPTLRWTF